MYKNYENIAAYEQKPINSLFRFWIFSIAH